MFKLDVDVYYFTLLITFSFTWTASYCKLWLEHICNL